MVVSLVEDDWRVLSKEDGVLVCVMTITVVSLVVVSLVVVSLVEDDWRVLSEEDGVLVCVMTMIGGAEPVSCELIEFEMRFVVAPSPHFPGTAFKTPFSTRMQYASLVSMSYVVMPDGAVEEPTSRCCT